MFKIIVNEDQLADLKRLVQIEQEGAAADWQVLKTAGQVNGEYTAAMEGMKAMAQLRYTLSCAQEIDQVGPDFFSRQEDSASESQVVNWGTLRLLFSGALHDIDRSQDEHEAGHTITAQYLTNRATAKALTATGQALVALAAVGEPY